MQILHVHYASRLNVGEKNLRGIYVSLDEKSYLENNTTGKINWDRTKSGLKTAAVALVAGVAGAFIMAANNGTVFNKVEEPSGLVDKANEGEKDTVDSSELSDVVAQLRTDLRKSRKETYDETCNTWKENRYVSNFLG